MNCEPSSLQLPSLLLSHLDVTIEPGNFGPIVIVHDRTGACLSNRSDRVVSYCSRRLAAEVAG